MVPEGWTSKPLSDLALLVMGQSPPSSACNVAGNGLPFFQGNAEFGFKYPVPKRWIENPLKLAKKDDILISVRAPVGELNIADTDCCIGRGVGAVRPTGTDRDFLYYSLLHSRKQMALVSQGSTFDAINGKQLAALALLVPPLPEQKKIAAILASVDEAIRATQAVIDQTRKVKQGLLQQLLTRGIGHTHFKQTEIGEIPEGWEVKQLKEVALVQTGIAKGKKGAEDPVERPYLRVANVQDGHLNLSEIKTITVPRKSIERYRLQAGDVLLTEGGDLDKLGRGDMWRGQIDSCLHQNHVFAVRVNREVLLPEFLSAQTGSSYGKRYFLGCAKQTTNLASINSTQLKEFPVLLPPIEEQKKMVAVLASVSEKIEEEQATLDRLAQLKTGLMQDLLTGRVRVGEVEGVKAAV